MKKLAILAAIATAMSSPTASADELCAKMKTFETGTRLADAARPQWIDVYWGVDNTAIFSVACVHHQMSASADLCKWLIDNMSKEFSRLLPQRILRCEKIRPNPFGNHEYPKRDIGFSIKAGGQFLLQTGNSPGSSTPWMRLALFPDRRKADAAQLPEATSYQNETQEPLQ